MGTGREVCGTSVTTGAPKGQAALLSFITILYKSSYGQELQGISKPVLNGER